MAQFVAHQEQFQALATQIVAISFGTPYWAKVWLQETQSPFPLLLDQEHKSYQAFGLERSFFKAWGMNNLLHYAKSFIKGEKLKENRGDTHQLGGDFIIDQNGFCRFAHPSKDPTDRPKLELILRQLEKWSSS